MRLFWETLSDTAESLARTAWRLKGIARGEWLSLEVAAAHLRKTSKAFEKIIARGELLDFPDLS